MSWVKAGSIRGPVGPGVEAVPISKLISPGLMKLRGGYALLFQGVVFVPSFLAFSSGSFVPPGTAFSIDAAYEPDSGLEAIYALPSQSYGIVELTRSGLGFISRSNSNSLLVHSFSYRLKQ